MKIQLKKMTLTNFKGVRSLDINFSRVTNISGDNGTGKTTVFDAFLWLFFGKDSTDRKDFQIKTLDENNQPFHKLDHEVSAEISVNGEIITLKRSMREKWVKTRGESTPKFSGHETTYFWNEVPLKLEEFNAKVSGLINENIFKLITNTAYFNAMKWQDRRSVLLELAGTISNAEIIDKLVTVQNKQHFQGLINALNSKKTVEEYKRELSSKKKKIKDELDLLPARIDEANRSLPEEVDYSELEMKLEALQSELKSVDNLLMNKSEAQRQHNENVQAKLREINQLRTRSQELVFQIKNSFADKRLERQKRIDDLKRQAKSIADDIQRLAVEFNNNTARKNAATAERDQLIKQWDTVNSEQLDFQEGQFHCPTCKREYEASDVEAKKATMISNFNESKTKRLNEITAQGKQKNADIAELETRLSNIKAEGETKRAEHNKLMEIISEAETEHQRILSNETEEVEKLIVENTEHQDIIRKIATLQAEADQPAPDDNSQALLTSKRMIQQDIDSIRTQLAGKEQREKILKRIEDLQKSERDMVDELNGFEGIEYAIELFTKEKMNTLVERINGRFKLVSFKLFDTQINGGEVEVCETLINGVPYSDANTASKINAGLDIINTLCDHYGVYAPVFIDNAESVNTLIPVNSQLIRLVVSKDKKLKVEVEKEQAELFA